MLLFRCYNNTFLSWWQTGHIFISSCFVPDSCPWLLFSSECTEYVNEWVSEVKSEWENEWENEPMDGWALEFWVPKSILQSSARPCDKAFSSPAFQPSADMIHTCSNLIDKQTSGDQKHRHTTHPGPIPEVQGMCVALQFPLVSHALPLFDAANIRPRLAMDKQPKTEIRARSRRKWVASPRLC